MSPKKKSAWLGIAIIFQLLANAALYSTEDDSNYATLSSPPGMLNSDKNDPESLKVEITSLRTRESLTSSAGNTDSTSRKFYSYFSQEWHSRDLGGILDQRKYTRRPKQKASTFHNRSTKYANLGRPTTYNPNKKKYRRRQYVPMPTYYDPEVPRPKPGRRSKYPLVTLYPNNSILVRARSQFSVLPEYFLRNPTSSINPPFSYTPNYTCSDYKIAGRKYGIKVLRPYRSKPKGTGNPGRPRTYNPRKTGPYIPKIVTYPAGHIRRKVGRPTKYPLMTLFPNDSKLFRVSHTTAKYFSTTEFIHSATTMILNS